MKIQIDEGLCQQIQAKSLEVDARRSIISFMLSNNMNTNTEQFNRYQEEYNQFFVEFELLKAELEKSIIIPVVGEKSVDWLLDYSTCEITIIEK